MEISTVLLGGRCPDTDALLQNVLDARLSTIHLDNDRQQSLWVPSSVKVINVTPTILQNNSQLLASRKSFLWIDVKREWIEVKRSDKEWWGWAYRRNSIHINNLTPGEGYRTKGLMMQCSVITHFKVNPKKPATKELLIFNKINSLGSQCTRLME